jgi:hypothetical protein
MSAEVTIVCDLCAVIIVAARTATEARREGIRDKMMVRDEDGKDICRDCNKRRRTDEREN